jgi:hypothetical protein
VRISLDTEVALDVATFHDERRAIVAQAREELPAHSKARRAVTGALLDAGKAKKQFMDGFFRDSTSLRHRQC